MVHFLWGLKQTKIYNKILRKEKIRIVVFTKRGDLSRRPELGHMAICRPITAKENRIASLA